jgi:hypothetical protein
MELTSACLYELLRSHPRLTVPQAADLLDFVKPERRKQRDTPSTQRGWWAKLDFGKKPPLRPLMICGCPGAAM